MHDLKIGEDVLQAQQRQASRARAERCHLDAHLVERALAELPKIFAQTDLVVVNKADLAELVGVDPEGIMDDYRKINPHGAILLTAARRGEGISALIEEMELGRHA